MPRLRNCSCILLLALLSACFAVPLGATSPAQGRQPLQVVIPYDPHVATLSLEAIQRYAGEFRAAAAQTNVLLAALLFDAIGASGVRYVGPQMNNRDRMATDLNPSRLFRNPGETLKSRAGNDEDLAVLYASALMSSGLRTALIVTSGPLLVAFDTAIRTGSGERFFSSDEHYLRKGGTVWLPVDVAALGDSFSEAWDAASRFPKRLLIEARGALSPHDSSARNGHDAVVLDASFLDSQFRFDHRYFSRLIPLTGDIPSVGISPFTFFLRIYALQADLGRFEEASASLQSAASMGAPQQTVLFYRANLLDRQGRYREMARVGGELVALDPDNPRGYLVSAQAASKLGDHERAKAYYLKARSLSASAGRKR